MMAKALVRDAPPAAMGLMEGAHGLGWVLGFRVFKAPFYLKTYPPLFTVLTPPRPPPDTPSNVLWCPRASERLTFHSTGAYGGPLRGPLPPPPHATSWGLTGAPGRRPTVLLGFLPPRRPPLSRISRLAAAWPATRAPPRPHHALRRAWPPPTGSRSPLPCFWAPNRPKPRLAGAWPATCARARGPCTPLSPLPPGRPIQHVKPNETIRIFDPYERGQKFDRSAGKSLLISLPMQSGPL
jgi:hypothetical protein